MKTSTITLALILLFLNGYSQYKFDYRAGITPAIKKEKLQEAVFLNDLTPLLWQKMELPYGERYLLEQRRINEYPQPQGYLYPQERYKEVIDVVSAEISTSVNGKTLSARSIGDKLTAEQKTILNSAELGADVTVKIQYKYKDQRDDKLGSRSKIIEGVCVVRVVPENEAVYPGGEEQITAYYTKNVINKVADPNEPDKIWQATVTFTVNENGKVENVKMSRSSTDPVIDKALLNATGNMPAWKPAQNSKGLKVKQVFSIPFGEGGC